MEKNNIDKYAKEIKDYYFIYLKETMVAFLQIQQPTKLKLGNR